MSWSDFLGNEDAVRQLQRLVAAGRARRTVVLAGPAGVGKTTLACMLGLALNCTANRSSETTPSAGDFCGQCASCSHLADSGQLDELTASALEYREAEVKGNAREQAPLVIAPHPAIRVYPPDGDSLTMAQARALIRQSQLQPDAGDTWTLIVPDFDQARWTTQAALLKTLEEPSPRVTIVLLTRNPLALLPTVRSRALMVPLAPVPPEQLAEALRQRGGGEDAGLRARLAEGRPGMALRLDLEAYRRTRKEGLDWLRAALSGELRAVFAFSESTRSGKEKFETTLEILYSVLHDTVYLQSGFPEAVRNVDSLLELKQLALRLQPEHIQGLVRELDRVQASSTRNAFRPLALDYWALTLASGGQAASR